MAKNYYLAKSDPATYSFDDLERDGSTLWDGVKNPQALQAIRLMKDGDCVLCYHSLGQGAIVGWGYVDGDARPDPQNPKLAVFTYRFGGRLKVPVTLHQIKATGLFPDFLLVRNSRLSTMAIPADFLKWFRATAKSFKP